ncbi:MAG TPA: phosphoglucomutase, alpha-D-glucose phosphate-specific, partial [Microbacteriaceae bacterium]|nr:phosphoglucomutase, alpha-D-glucose phosphate-specific [Microbacteriaceae bacterium]
MDPRAGTPAEPSDLVDIEALIDAYHERRPDPSIPAERVVFGTSGHRGSSLTTSFNEDHIAATTQAIVDYRNKEGIAGPLFLGADTHALSAPAVQTALRVLAANAVHVLVDSRDDVVPTPALSHAIVRHNRTLSQGDPGRADGIIVTPSHNPPSDGGFKYNPPHGGPAGSDTTAWIANRANEIIADGMRAVGDGRARAGRGQGGADETDGAASRGEVGRYDFREHYVADLARIINVSVIAASGVRIGADPLGGASVHYWEAIRDRYGLNL